MCAIPRQSQNSKRNYLTLIPFVYVIVWLAVVIGINDVSNAGRKIIIVQGAAKHYYTFHTCIASTINPSATANLTVTY